MNAPSPRPDAAASDLAGAPSSAIDVGGNLVSLLADGHQIFAPMLAAIEHAEREILLEMYWFGSDTIGQRFAAALRERARAGLRVCVVYDAIGSIEADQTMFDAMGADGVEVHQYNPINPWRRRFRLGFVSNRDHRKILVVDRKIAFTGGVNIGDEWVSEAEGGGGWRDDMVRLEGPVAHDLAAVFLRTWQRVGGSGVRLDPPRPREAASKGPVRVIAGDYFGERREIRRTYLAEIRRARGYVFITNSYFVPDGIVRRALAKAVKRGVDVRVLLPAHNDVRAVQWASRGVYAWLLARGVKVYEYSRSILHGKTAVVDGRWCTVGTYNLDYRSWRDNLEVNVTIEHATIATAMRRRFEADLEQAAAIEAHAWGFRSLGDRFLQWVFYLFRKFL